MTFPTMGKVVSTSTADFFLMSVFPTNFCTLEEKVRFGRKKIIENVIYLHVEILGALHPTVQLVKFGFSLRPTFTKNSRLP